MFSLLSNSSYVNGIQNLHSCFTSISFVEDLVNFSVGAFPDCLYDFPGVSGIRKVVKDNRFPWLWKHLQERSPIRRKHDTRVTARVEEGDSWERRSWSAAHIDWCASTVIHPCGNLVTILLRNPGEGEWKMRVKIQMIENWYPMVNTIQTAVCLEFK